MNKKIIVPALIVVVLVIAAGFMAARKGSEHPDEKAAQGLQSPASGVQKTPEPPVAVPLPPATGSAVPAPATKPSEAHFSSGDEADGVDTQVFEIVYDGNAYTPNTLSIKAGDIVLFKNKSKNTFWPASNPHPLHTDYPEFDPKKPIAAGQTYEFKFLRVGTWKFHDHLSPTARGVITVTQ